MEVNEIIVKSEEGSEEIYFFYVDENGVGQNLSTNNIMPHQVIQEAGAITNTLENSDEANLQEQLANANGVTIYYDNNQYISNVSVTWTEEEIKHLLIFYIDNKETFVKGGTNTQHIWDVACKTMLAGRTAVDCEVKFNDLKRKYEDKQLQDMRYLVLCHKAFHDESSPAQDDDKSAVHRVNIDVVQNTKDGIIMLKKNEKPRSLPDEKVVTMLNMYIKAMKDNKGIKKTIWQQKIWDDIAATIGSENAELWHRKFLNFKQHYIRLLDKKNESGVESIQWPYIKYYEEIFKNDDDFIRKFVNTDISKLNCVTQCVNVKEIEWDVTEMTVLVKYYYDCYDDMLDPSLPKSFFWSEIGRLLDRTPESCELKYEQMRKQHLENYNDGTYDLVNRVPLAILYDNIISRDVDIELQNYTKHCLDLDKQWSVDDIDKLAQLIYDNVELYKDPICYNVCLCRVSRVLEKSVRTCKEKWEELVMLYKTLLKDKKDNPDQDIDWRYIDIFDRIFDYGMNETLLAGHERQVCNQLKVNAKVEKTDEELEDEEMLLEDEIDDDFISDDGNLLAEKRQGGAEKAFKILEFYQKNKSLFNISNRNKSSVWQPVANDIKMSASECAHRFRNLKQVYIYYLRRECKSPEKPIVWPYYALCKKVFGYRALKSKIMKNSDADYAIKEWSAKEIKTLINYYSENYAFVNKNYSDSVCWAPLACQIKKTENACKVKFMEMRKSYRKLKTMMTRNPKVKISWKYFNKFDEICSRPEENNEKHEEIKLEDDIKEDIHDDDEMQCIIVVPEGQTLEEAVRNANVSSAQTDSDQAKTTTSKKWTKLLKKRLLNHVLRHVEAHKGQRIDSEAMWKKISEKIANKSPVICRRMYLRIKKRRLAKIGDDKIPSYYSVLDKILSLEPKFFRKPNIFLEHNMEIEALEPIDLDVVETYNYELYRR